MIPTHTFARTAASGALFLALAACGSTDISKATKPYRQGDFALAAAEISEISGESGTDGVWIQMEKGSILKSAGLFAESQAALEVCQQQMDSLLQSAGEESVAVGGLSGAGAVMTDDRQCTYVGALYETQLVCSLQAMNGLLQSDLAQAQAAISTLRARVDEADEAKAKARDFLEKKRAQNEEEAAAKGASSEGLKLQTLDDRVKEAYSSWADSALGIGLFLGAIVDRESGKGSEFPGLMDRSAESAKPLQHLGDKGLYQNLAAGLVGASRSVQGLPAGAATYVIIESGLAPYREINGELMQKYQNDKGLDVQLPVLRHEPESVRGGWKVSAGSAAVADAHLVTSVSVVKQNEFDVNYPDIEYRAVLGKIIKKTMTAAGAAVAIASDDSTAQLIGLGVLIFGAFSDALQGADLRSWDCLPSAYYVAAIPTPDDGALKISSGDGSCACDVKLVPGVSNIVVVTSLAPGHCISHAAPVRPAPAPAN